MDYQQLGVTAVDYLLKAVDNTTAVDCVDNLFYISIYIFTLSSTLFTRLLATFQHIHRHYYYYYYIFKQ